MPSELYYPSGTASLNPNISKQNTISLSAATTIWTPASGKAIVLYGLMFSYSAAVAGRMIIVQQNTTDIWAINCAGVDPVFLSFETGLRIFAVNDIIRLRATVVTNFNYIFWGTEV